MHHPGSWKRNFFIVGIIFLIMLGLAGGLPELFKTLHGMTCGALSRPDRIVIDIKHKAFQKLEYKRQTAIKQGILIARADDDVPAVIQYKDRKINVRLRLKGDWVHDHLTGENWSFRVKLRGDETMFGMRTFSLHRPSARNYVGEWFFHETLKREGVMGLRYRFVEVVINGKNHGIYALEEHFDRRLIENNQGREGIVLAFQEDLLWHNKLYWNMNIDFRRDMGFHSADIRAYELKRVLESPRLSQQFLAGVELLERLRLKELPLSRVYDIHQWAKYYALSDLLGAVHSRTYTNQKFYYNPVTGRVEPIGFDANAYLKTKNLIGEYYADAAQEPDTYYWTQNLNLWEDLPFARQYIRELRRVSRPEYVEGLYNDLKERLTENVHIVRKSHPLYRFDKNILLYNAKVIRKKLEPLKAFHAYVYRVLKDEVVLTIANIQTLPVEISGLLYDGQVLLRPKEPIVLAPKNKFSAPRYQRCSFILPDGFVWERGDVSHLQLNYHILGLSQDKSDYVYLWPHLDDTFMRDGRFRAQDNVQQFEFLVVDPSRKQILIKPGHWEIEQDIRIPAGYQVVGFEGVHLNLHHAAKIISYSPVKLIGTADHPVIIESSDATGQGLFVLQTQQDSVLEHVIFRNLSFPSSKWWQLTGAVTFYEAPVRIKQCLFQSNRAEDALNIIRSRFQIEETLFSDHAFDGLDVDFSDGSITKSSFVRCGNDGIDLSGSYVSMTRVRTLETRDKGISVGEQSEVHLRQVDIAQAGIGLAAKDRSVVCADGLSIQQSGIGLALFQKKSEFGPASMQGEQVTFDEVKIPYLVEDSSTLELDGKIIPADQDQFDQYLSHLKK
ncbi:MAG: CotH kinase family protein [Candidatus Omnitrophica bacterium]|nr:CotH kinase family protein [Candidatus Omnitrophota bacterium]